LQRSPKLPSWFKGTYFQGRRGGNGERMGREGERRERKKEEGKWRGQPLSQIPGSAQAARGMSTEKKLVCWVTVR